MFVRQSGIAKVFALLSKGNISIHGKILTINANIRPSNFNKRITTEIPSFLTKLAKDLTVFVAGLLRKIKINSSEMEIKSLSLMPKTTNIMYRSTIALAATTTPPIEHKKSGRI